MYSLIAVINLINAKLNYLLFGSVAQLVAQETLNLLVVGSSPTRPKLNNKGFFRYNLKKPFNIPVNFFFAVFCIKN